MDSLDLLRCVISATNVYVFAKGLDGKYLYASENLAAAAGLDSPSQIVGLTDHDLVWSDQAEIYRAGDNTVLNGGRFVLVPEIQTQISGLKEITTSKAVLTSNTGTIKGVAGSFIENTGKCFLEISGTYEPRKRRVMLDERFPAPYLSFKEARVYKHLLLGKSAPDIANTIHVSKSTVQFHIENLKKKIGSESQGALLADALTTGLAHTILAHI